MALEKTRVIWVDAFKAFMIFFVAFGHAVYEGEPVGDACNYYIHAFHVAGFFFVSGYLFSNKAKNFIEFFKKKCISLMVPYYIFAFISLGIFALMGTLAASGLGVEIKTTDIWKNIVGIFYASGLSGYMKWNLPMWFIPCLFVSLIIFFFIIKFIGFMQKKTSFHFANGIMMIVLLAINFINYYFADIKCLPFGLEVSLYMMPIMLLGFWLRHCIKVDCLNNVSKFILGAVCILLGGGMSLWIGASVSFVSSIYGNLFVFYISCVLNILGFMFLSGLINSKVVNYVGQNTLVILMLHKFPIVFMQLFLERYMKNFWGNNIGLSVIMTVASIGVSLICGEIITKICPIMLGKKRN